MRITSPLKVILSDNIFNCTSACFKGEIPAYDGDGSMVIIESTESDSENDLPVAIKGITHTVKDCKN